MTVSVPPPSSTNVPLTPSKLTGATLQAEWRPSGSGPGGAVPSSATLVQPRSKQRSGNHPSDQDVATGLTAALTPVPQLESDFPAAAFAAVLKELWRPEPSADGSTQNSSQGLAGTSGADLPQLSPVTPASVVMTVPVVVPASVVMPAPVVMPTSVVVPAPVVASVSVAQPASVVVPASAVVPGPPVRSDEISPKTKSAKTTTSVPIPGLEGVKPSTPGGAAQVREPHPREGRSVHPAGFDQPATPYVVAGMHAGADRGRAGDVPAPESESGKLPTGPQTAAAQETPAGGAATSPATPTPHPLAFAARLVERPATVIAGDDFPAQDPKAQTPTSTEAAAPSGPALPVSSGAAAQGAPRTASPLLPQDRTEPAPALTPQPAKPEELHSANTSVGLPASAPRREDTGNPTAQPRVGRQDSAENLPTAGPRGPAPAGGAAVAGFERLPTPPRADPSAPVEQNPATDRAKTTAQVLGVGAPREAAVASPAQNISVRLSSDGHPVLEVRVMDRGGEVRVAVHSPDPATSETVRAGLPELVERLGQRGYETEIWRPPAAQSSSSAQGESGGSFGRGSQQDPSGREQRHPQRQPQPAWLEELDSNLNSNSNRSASSWRP